MHPPDGPLAPLPGAEILFRVLPKSIPQKRLVGFCSLRSCPPIQRMETRRAVGRG